MIDLKYQVETLTDENTELKDENSNLKESMAEESEMRTNFESKLSTLKRTLDSYQSQLKLSQDDLEDLKEENKNLKKTNQTQETSLILLTADKIKLDREVTSYRADSAMLKEDIMSKKSVINQRDSQLKQLHHELQSGSYEIQELKKIVEQKNIRISVIQSKIIDRKNENNEIEVQMDKIKRVNLICEDRIKTLHQNLTEMTNKYEAANVSYESFKSQEELYRTENKDLKTQISEIKNKFDLLEIKFSGIDVKYQNLSEAHQALKENYEKTSKILEDVNKSRNKLFDEVNQNQSKIADINREKEGLEHIIFQEKALTKKLQDRLSEQEDEYEKLSRIETSNAQMSAIQISALESKYLAMFKKHKSEEKLKNKWVQSYQKEYNQNLQNDIELKQAEANRNTILDKNKELKNLNEDLSTRIQVMETQAETLQDEKADLLAKVERKNLEIEGHK